MNSIDIENILNRKGVKPTSNRILVVRELMKASHPVSLADLEILLGFSMDKASIFRVLELFSEKEIVHVIEDGSRSFKYELCLATHITPFPTSMFTFIASGARKHIVLNRSVSLW